MKRIVFFLFVACLPLYLFAQSVSVNAEMDSVNIWIGEQTKFTISAIQPNNKVLNFPLFSDSIVDGLEIVEQCKRDTVVLPSGDIKVSDSYVVTAFDSALILVPKLVITDENDCVKEINLKNSKRDFYYNNLVNAGFFIVNPKALEYFTK